jgi:arsenate reductase
MSFTPTVMILCTGNSCRSQMAEGFLRQLAGDRYNVISAGTDPKDEVHPLAVQVMAEVGIDISGQSPTDLAVYLGKVPVRHLMIVCDRANASCPTIWPGMMHRHYWPFDDPAAFTGPDEQAIPEFRRVRDEIRERLEQWLATEAD